MNLRIAHVTATFPPYQGGTGNVCYHNARELARRGHDVHVFTAAMLGVAEQEVCDGFAVHRLRALVRIGNAPLLPGLVSALRGFDIIHLHYPFILGGEMVRLASALYGTPMVVSFHNDLIGNGTRARLFSLYQPLAARLTLRAAAQVCAVSLDHYRSSLLRRSLSNQRQLVVELPNGVDPDLFCPTGPTGNIRESYGIPRDVKLTLFVAALDSAHYFKGLDRLLQAFQVLPQNVWLLVIGDGDLRSDYEQQAYRLGIMGRTVFAGAIDHQCTPQFFRSADVTVLPSSPPESFGLVLIESLACGTPVVASDIPGVRTVVNHGRDGLLVEANSSTALGEAIRHILSDDGARLKMGKLGRAKIEAYYGWKQIGARLEAIYRNVLSFGHYTPWKEGRI
jgi:glycosyltransferase involved in cell wall biosynthesis